MAQTSLLDKIKFNPIVYQRNDADLSQLAETFKTLRVMHEEAIENKTKLETAVANAPLDESEEWYKQAILDTIQTTINEKTDGFGLAGAAQAINQLTADIINSKEFRGKVAANAAHKAFLEELRKMNLPKWMEKYYEEKNPYVYDNNVTDGNGRELMYEWKPKEDIVPLPDTNKIIQTALQQLSPNKSGGYINTYLYDELGNRLDDWTKGGFQIDETGNRVWLPPEKISSAIRGIIRRDYALEESFRKMFEIGKWYDKKYSDTDDPTYARKIPFAEDGITTMNFDEWLYHLFKPAADNLSYYEGYAPTAAMRNKDAGITTGKTSRGSGRRYSNSADKQAKEADKQTVDELTAAGVSSTAAKKVVKQAKQHRSSSNSNTSRTNNKGASSGGTKTTPKTKSTGKVTYVEPNAK